MKVEPAATRGDVLGVLDERDASGCLAEGEVLEHGIGRRCRAWIVRDDSEGVVGVLVVSHGIALPMVLQPSAAPELAKLISAVPVTQILGLARHVDAVLAESEQWTASRAPVHVVTALETAPEPRTDDPTRITLPVDLSAIAALTTPALKRSDVKRALTHGIGAVFCEGGAIVGAAVAYPLGRQWTLVRGFEVSRAAPAGASDELVVRLRRVAAAYGLTGLLLPDDVGRLVSSARPEPAEHLVLARPARRRRRRLASWGVPGGR